MFQMKEAEENEKIFEFLDECFLNKSSIPRSSIHAKELYEAFKIEDFGYVVI